MIRRCTRICKGGRTVDVETIAKSCENGVGDVDTGATTKGCARGVRTTNERCICNPWLGTCFCIVVGFQVVSFDTAVSTNFDVARLHDEDILDTAAVALGPVNTVVFDIGQNQVTCIDGSAEEFDTVIGVCMDLDVFDHGSTANTLERDPVQFVFVRKEDAGELDTCITQYATAVIFIIATVWS